MRRETGTALGCWALVALATSPWPVAHPVAIAWLVVSLGVACAWRAVLADATTRRWLLGLAATAALARGGAAACGAGQGLDCTLRVERAPEQLELVLDPFGGRQPRLGYAGVSDGFFARPLPIAPLNHVRYAQAAGGQLGRPVELRWTGWIVSDRDARLDLLTDGEILESRCEPATVTAGQPARLDVRVRTRPTPRTSVRLDAGNGDLPVPTSWLWSREPPPLRALAPWFGALAWLAALAAIAVFLRAAWIAFARRREGPDPRPLAAGALVTLGVIGGSVLWELKAARGPEYSVLPRGDYLYYESHARDLVANGLWTDDGLAFHRSAAMRYYVAAGHWLAGDGAYGIAMWQCAALGLAAFLIALCWSELTGRPRWAWVPALAVLFLPKQLQFGLRFYPTVSATLLLAALIWSLLRATRDAQPRARWLLGAGLLAGLLALFRPHTLLLGLVVPAWLVVRQRGWRPAVWFVAPMIALAALVPLRNRVVAGTWTPLPTLGPVNLLIGNAVPASMDPAAIDTGSADRDARFQAGARRLLDFENNPDRSYDPFPDAQNLEMHGPLRRLFVEYLRTHPGHFAWQLCSKSVRLVLPLERPFVIVISLLALLGVWRLRRADGARRWIPLAVVGSCYAVPLIVIIFHHRHRAPLLGLLLLPATYGLMWGVDRWRGRTAPAES